MEKIADGFNRFFNERKILWKDKFLKIETKIEQTNIKMQGLYYLKNVLDAQTLEEVNMELQERFLKESFSVGGGKNSRKVIHYGYEYNYKTGDVGNATLPFPSFIEKLSNIVKSLGLEKDPKIVQCIINKYEPGQGIGAHIDSKKYGEFIYCFTFGSGADMEFSKDGQKCSIYTEPNSLYIMSGESRNLWKHEMRPRLTDTVNGKKVKRATRISITFRSIL